MIKWSCHVLVPVNRVRRHDEHIALTPVGHRQPRASDVLDNEKPVERCDLQGRRDPRQEDEEYLPRVLDARVGAGRASMLEVPMEGGSAGRLRGCHEGLKNLK